MINKLLFFLLTTLTFHVSAQVIFDTDVISTDGETCRLLIDCDVEVPVEPEPAYSIPIEIGQSTPAKRGGILEYGATMFGVPFAVGELQPDTNLVVRHDAEIVGTSTPFAFWPDGSVRWLRVMAQSRFDAPLVLTDKAAGHANKFPSLINETIESIQVDDLYTIDKQTGLVSGGDFDALSFFVTHGESMEVLTPKSIRVAVNSPFIGIVELKLQSNDIENRKPDIHAWLQFEKGTPRISIRATIINADINHWADATFSKVGINIKKPITAYQSNLVSGESSALLYQGPRFQQRVLGNGSIIHRPINDDYEFNYFLNCSDYGDINLVKTVIGECVNNTWAPDQEYSGAIVVTNGERTYLGHDEGFRWVKVDGIEAAIRYGDTRWATSYYVDEGGLLINLIDMPETVLIRGGAMTYDVVVGENAYQAANMPVIGRVSFERYRDSGAIFDNDDVADIDEEKDFWLVSGYNNSRNRIFRAENNIVPQIVNFILWRRNYNEPYAHVLRWMRGNQPGWLHYGEMHARHVYDAGGIRSDGFNLIDNPQTGGLNTSDAAHETSLGGLLYAYISGGHPYWIDAALDFSEYRIASATITYGQPIGNGYNLPLIFAQDRPASARPLIRHLRHLMVFPDFFESLGFDSSIVDQHRMLPAWEIYATKTVEPRGTPHYPFRGNNTGWDRIRYSKYGWSETRGFWYFTNTYNFRTGVSYPAPGSWVRYLHPFFTPQLYADMWSQVTGPLKRWDERPDLADLLLNHRLQGEALFYSYEMPRMMEKNDPYLETRYRGTGGSYYADVYKSFEVADRGEYNYLSSQFAVEAYHLFGYTRHLPDAILNTLAKTVRPSGDWQTGKIQVLRLMRVAVEQWLAGKSFAELQRMRDDPGIDYFDRLPADLTNEQLADLASRWAHRKSQPRDGWKTVTELSEGAQIRCARSGKKIVDWLGFDVKIQNFAFDPAEHDAWFAADIVSEPDPERDCLIKVKAPDGHEELNLPSVHPILTEDDVYPESTYILKRLNKATVDTPINIVAVASGYRNNQIDRENYKADWQHYLYHMFGLEDRVGSNFFVDYRNYFNVYVITDNREGADVLVFDDDGDEKTPAELATLRQSLPEDMRCNFYNSAQCRMFLVELRNRPATPGNAGEGRVYVGRRGSEDWPNRYELAHEFAHMVLHPVTTLQDEYISTECLAGSDRAVNIHDKNSNVKWADYISTPPFQGADNCAERLWRPSENSIMRDVNEPDFDALGYAVMEKGLQMRLGETEASRPTVVCDLASNQVISGDTTINCTVTDASAIRFVEFFVSPVGSHHRNMAIQFEPDSDGTYSWTLMKDAFGDGDYYLRVVAWDEHFSWGQYNPAFSIQSLPEVE